MFTSPSGRQPLPTYFDQDMISRIFRLVLPVFVVAALCGMYRLWAHPVTDARPLPRLRPVVIAPLYDWPEVATDTELRQILDRMKPPAKPHTNNYVHALRMWGAHVDFGNTAHPSGQAMLNYFLSDAAFQAAAGAGVPPLFLADASGVRPRSWREIDSQRNTSAVHTDDLLATLAEVGTPSNTVMQLRSSTVTVADLLQTALADYHSVQYEYEWTAIAYARYVFPAKTWTNRDGQTIHVDDLVEQLIDHSLEQGVCGGTHRLEALVVLYRANELTPVLSVRTKKRIVEHLTSVSRLLVQSQHADGHWSRTWFRGANSGQEAVRHAEDDMLLTGHHLEWLALAPRDVQPPRETILRASHWLVNAVLETDQAVLEKRFGPLSHAARALCLWRGKEPGAVWGQGDKATR